MLLFIIAIDSSDQFWFWANHCISLCNLPVWVEFCFNSLMLHNSFCYFFWFSRRKVHLTDVMSPQHAFFFASEKWRLYWYRLKLRLIPILSERFFCVFEREKKIALTPNLLSVLWTAGDSVNKCNCLWIIARLQIILLKVIVF